MKRNELIKALRSDNFGADDLENHISRCADAIEQLVAECKTLKHNLATVVKDCDKLVKERDAAVADMLNGVLTMKLMVSLLISIFSIASDGGGNDERLQGTD